MTPYPDATHVLHRVIRMRPEEVCQMVGARVVLDNIAITRNKPLVGEEVNQHEVEIAPFHGAEDGRAVCDHICHTFF